MKKIPLTPTEERGLDRLTKREAISIARLLIRSRWLEFRGQHSLAAYWRLTMLDQLERKGAAEEG